MAEQAQYEELVRQFSAFGAVKRRWDGSCRPTARPAPPPY